jgi:hypothetical protein
LGGVIFGYEQIKRNKNRFPENFMFQLSEKEVEVMVSQNAIPANGHCFTLRKTQSERFWLLCVVGVSQLPWGKKALLFLWAFKRKGIQFCFFNSTIVMFLTFPLIAARAVLWQGLSLPHQPRRKKG